MKEAKLLKKLACRMPGYSQLIEVMDDQSTSSIDAIDLARVRYPAARNGLKVLDLGCGEGMSAFNFRRIDAKVDWYGVDIESSPEVDARISTGENFQSFDGVNLPYEAELFDMVYCQQVLEHVFRPRELLAEVHRVLKPGGQFLGSVSYLEPYHSYSIFNFTPYGLIKNLEDLEFRVDLIKPCSGLHYKILRQMSGGFEAISKLSKFSIWGGVVSILGALSRSDKRDVNLLKLQYSSTFSFAATKQSSLDVI